MVYSGSYVIGGDNHPKAIARAKSNIDGSAARCKVDLVHWSVSQLPFKDSYVDIVVTDMVINVNEYILYLQHRLVVFSR